MTRARGPDEQASKDLLRTLVDHVPAMLGYWDASLRCRIANQAYLDWFGVDPEAVIGQPMREVLGAHYETSLPHAQAALRGEPQTFEREFKPIGGAPPRFVHVEYVPHAIGGQVLGFFVLVVDVTERRLAAEAARQAELEQRTAMNNSPLAMAVVNLEGRWLRVNRVLCELLGYSAEELLGGMTFQDVTHPDDLGLDMREVEKLLLDQVPRYELAKRYIRKDGQLVETMLHVSLIRDDDGKPHHFISQIVDLSERRKLEARVAQGERMASLGTLAAGVAHEVNNPLAYVMANLDTVTRTLQTLGGEAPSAHIADALELVGEAREGAERVRMIVRGLQAFARPSPEELAIVEVADVLRVAIAMSAHELRHRARLVEELAPVAPVEAGRTRLAQVFVNLLVNAAQAIPEGHVDAHTITVRLFEDERGRVVVEIRDTGAGMAPEVVGRIFEPFFTTRPIGAGTGLGLSIAHGIVRSLGGEITAESQVGVGTTLRVALPRAQRGAPAEVAPSAPSSSATVRPRVLVVDDEPMVGRAIARALATDHDVTVASNGAQALALVLEQSFDVVVSDLMMPQMTGMELHAKLRVERPALAARVVFITGGAFTPAAQAFLQAVSNPVLEKPLQLNNLRVIIRGLTDSGG